MKIAIYGDSFADTKNIFLPENDYSWVNCLKNKNYDITNYAQAASSLHYSYDNFIKTHKDYDKIIFVFTGRDRFILEGLPGDDKFITVSMVDYIKSRMDFSDYNATQREMVEACRLYYKYIVNYEKEALFHGFLIKEIRNIRPDGLYIPCFPDCFLPGTEIENVIDLNYFSTFDYNYFNLSVPGTKSNYVDKRYCHMNEGNNRMLANKVEHWLKTAQFTLTKDDAVNPTNILEYYFLG